MAQPSRLWNSSDCLTYFLTEIVRLWVGATYTRINSTC